MNKNNNTVQAFWLAIGSLAAFSFSIINGAILSRYLIKTEYGTYRQILYVYTTLLVIFSVGLPKAFSYFLPRVDITEGRSLINKMTVIFLLLGSIFSLLLYLASPIIAQILKNPELEVGLKYFSLVPVLMLPTMGLEGIFSTFKKTYIVAIYNVATRITMLLFIVLPVMFYQRNYLIAVKGFVLSSFLSFLLALYLKYKPFKGVVSIKTSVSYKTIFKFSLPLMYASIWGMLISSADQFFISRYFGKAVFADFANGSLQLPFVAMITGATASVLQPIFSKMVSDGKTSDLLPVWKSALEKSAILIYPLVIFFWVYADNIMVLLYGSLYKDSSAYFRIMSLLNFFNIITFAPAMFALNATKFYAKVHFFIALIIWALQFVVVKFSHNPYLISAASVICRSSMILIFCIFISRGFNVQFVKLFPAKTIAKTIVSSSLVLAIIKLVFRHIFLLYNYSDILILLTSFCVYIFLLILILRLIKIDYLAVFKPLLRYVGK